MDRRPPGIRSLNQSKSSQQRADLQIQIHQMQHSGGLVEGLSERPAGGLQAGCGFCLVHFVGISNKVAYQKGKTSRWSY